MNEIKANQRQRAADVARTYRSHRCGELTDAHCGQEVQLCGWVHRIRDLGGLMMLELRDRYGIVQLCCEEGAVAEGGELMSRLAREMVLQVWGQIRSRPDGAQRLDTPTGAIEVHVRRLKLLAPVQGTLPYLFDAPAQTKEELRLKYRYLELRHPERQRVLQVRSEAAYRARSFLRQQGFLEVETPMLYKPTPEGARDFLIPARATADAAVYALPQSPQMLKQLLMISGCDRYYQIVKCFRDEDQRSDRQPEFTQIDIEASFVTEASLRELAHAMCCELFEQPGLALPQLAYDDACELFGTDKPDLRYGLPLVNLAGICSDMALPPLQQVFAAADQLAPAGVYGIYVPAAVRTFSRKEITAIGEQLEHGTAESQLRFFYFKVEQHEPSGGIAKWLDGDRYQRMMAAQQQAAAAVGAWVRGCASLQDGAGTGTWFIVAYSDLKRARQFGDGLRRALATQCSLIDEAAFALAWIHRFPLFEYDSELAQFVSAHHPFTMPHPDCLEEFLNLEAALPSGRDKAALVAQSYDVVCNGFELASGSIRIHSEAIQRKAFERLGMSEQQINDKFGFFLEALRYGAPPHGGIAFGLDRIVMLLAGCHQLRDVMAFPKTTAGTCLMSGAPHPVSADELQPYGMSLLAQNR